ncbi:MAG: hypothetical protein KC483_08630 [Nitrosarchaeum sp.]|nr:hypothetical protein [Nitrosarchaeum sp.]
MDFEKFLKQHNLMNYAAGLTGCRSSSNCSFNHCDYDITVFDNKSDSESIIHFGNDLVCLHHGSLDESNSKILVQYAQMQILQDSSWELKIFLSKIKDKRSELILDNAKNCLIDAMLQSQKCLVGIGTDIFASCWQKCASFSLADAICLLNGHCPSSSHTLDMMRKFEKNPINEAISTVNETSGIERATPSLLERMFKSTIGFSDFVNKTRFSKIMQKKYDFFIKNSMLADCYFYLGNTNKENFLQIKNVLTRKPELIHILKIALDIESDPMLLSQHSKNIQKACKELLVNLV